MKGGRVRKVIGWESADSRASCNPEMYTHRNNIDMKRKYILRNAVPNWTTLKFCFTWVFMYSTLVCGIEATVNLQIWKWNFNVFDRRLHFKGWPKLKFSYGCSKTKSETDSCRRGGHESCTLHIKVRCTAVILPIPARHIRTFRTPKL